MRNFSPSYVFFIISNKNSCENSTAFFPDIWQDLLFSPTQKIILYSFSFKYHEKAWLFLNSIRILLTMQGFWYKIKERIANGRFCAQAAQARENRFTLCFHLKKMKNMPPLRSMHFWQLPRLRQYFYVYWILEKYETPSAHFLRHCPLLLTDLWWHICAIQSCVFMSAPFCPSKKRSVTCARCAEFFHSFSQCSRHLQ